MEGLWAMKGTEQDQNAEGQRKHNWHPYFIDIGEGGNNRHACTVKCIFGKS